MRRKHSAPRKFWTPQETEILKALYPSTVTKEVAKTLGRELTAVYRMASKLGLCKTAEFRNSPLSGRISKGHHDGRGTRSRFTKGIVPANKGLRRPGWAPGRMRETQFKKGERRGAAARNWCPVGTIKADSEGYLRIKVREAEPGEAYGFGNTKVCPLLARHVWEQHNGPIPPKHIIKFRDGNRSNCTINNLELKSMADNARDNSMWNADRYPRELAEVIQLNGALKRKLRRTNGTQQD